MSKNVLIFMMYNKIPSCEVLTLLHTHTQKKIGNTWGRPCAYMLQLHAVGDERPAGSGQRRPRRIGLDRTRRRVGDRETASSPTRPATATSAAST
jgi:hypothetical protein